MPVDIEPAIAAAEISDVLLAAHQRHIEKPARLTWRVVDDMLADRSVFNVRGLPPGRALHAPLMTKGDLRNHLEDWINRTVLDESLWEKQTTGTTGPPMAVVQTALFQFDQLFLAPLRAVIGHGRPNSPSGVLLALTDNPDSENLIWPNPWGGAVIQLRIDEVDRLREVIAVAKPDLITAKPHLLACVADSVDLQALVDCPILISGANVTATEKLSLKERTGAVVVEAYGLTETGLVAFDCSCGKGLRVDSDVIAEVLDVHGDSVLPGEIGQVVLTSLRNRAIPLIRYATGDLARVASPSTCEAVHFTEMVGRALRPFRGMDGRLVPPARFHALFTAFPISEFQLVERCPGRWKLIVELQSGAEVRSSDLSSWVIARAKAPVELDIEFGNIDTRAGKFQRYQVLDEA